MTRKIPVALTIAGSDSGGGAGIQADLKTFAALGVHGASAIACITAQNPRRVLASEPVSAKMLRRQIEAVFEELRPAAAKTGMLFTAENIRVVANFFRNRQSATGNRQLVVDPVMISTSGAPLLEPAAIKTLLNQLLPVATLVTPNLDEAEVLTGEKISSVEDMRSGAHQIHARFGCAALVKGGHLRGIRQAVDIFFDGRTELLLASPLVQNIRTHGTGCTLSAAIAGHVARGLDFSQAAVRAKEFVTQAIAGSYRIGRNFALNQSFNLVRSR